MVDSLIAEFPSQFAASAAVDMLLSRGVARDRLALRFDENVGQSVTQDDRHEARGPRITHRLFRQRTLHDLPTPQTSGHTYLMVRLADATEVPELTEALRLAGATSVQRPDVDASAPAQGPPGEAASAEAHHAGDAVPATPRDALPPKHPRH
ncbi:MAG: hypothetical protein ABW154_07275 [Dyella sp.]